MGTVPTMHAEENRVRTGLFWTMALAAGSLLFPAMVQADPFASPPVVVNSVSIVTGAGYGGSIALSDDGLTAVIGEIRANRAYVYRYVDGAWTGSLILSDPGLSINDGFASAIALSGDGNFVLVCAPGAGKGYVYDITSGLTLVATLTSPTAHLGDDFCASAALPGNGSLAVIGAPLARVGTAREAGAVYVYIPESNGIWKNSSTTVTEPGGAGDFNSFGNALALSHDGSKLMVGAIHAIGGGKAYLLDLKAGVGTLAHEFDDPIGGNDIFGWAVALSASGNRALISAPFTAVSGAGASGQVYAYTLSGGNWGTPDVFSDTKSTAGQLGGSLALSTDGDFAVFGEPSGDKAFAASFANGNWSSLEKVSDPQGSFGNSFGVVALSGDGAVAFIGAPNTRVLGLPEAGRVYEYGLSSSACAKESCGTTTTSSYGGNGGYPLLVLLILGWAAGRRGMGLRIKD